MIRVKMILICELLCSARIVTLYPQRMKPSKGARSYYALCGVFFSPCRTGSIHMQGHFRPASGTGRSYHQRSVDIHF